MKKSEKLYYSLGSVRDEWLDDAIGADITKNKVKSGGKTIALRRLMVAAAVCVLSVCLAITCVANADLIKSLFQREQELINPYAAMIDETSEAEGVTMKMDKIAKDGDRYIIYLHLSRPEGFEPGFLFHSGIKVEQETSEGWQTRADIPGATNAETALLAGTFLTQVEAETQELDVLLTINSWEYPYFNEVKKDSFRLSIYDLATAQIIEEEGGSVKNLGTFADEITVDFEFDESKIESLPEKVSYPDIEFEVDGSKFKLTEMRYTPMHLELHIEDEIGQTIKVGGKELFATDKLNYSTYSVDDPPAPYPSEGVTYTEEEFEKFRQDNTRRNEENTKWRAEYGNELISSWYSLKVETALEDKQWSCAHTYEVNGREYDMNKPVMTWYFSKPMYEEDILSIAFERYIYEEYPANADTKYTVDRVVVWENPNAVKPEAANPAAE